MQVHFTGKGNIRRRPADAANRIQLFRNSPNFSGLGFKCHRAVTEHPGHFLMADNGAIHRPGTNRPVVMRIEVYQQPFHTAAQVENRGPPQADVFHPHGCVNQYNPMVPIDRCQGDPRVFSFNQNILCQFNHNPLFPFFISGFLLVQCHR